MGLIAHQQFAFLPDPQKIAEFRRWLAVQTQLRLITVSAEQIENAWWQRYIEEGYRKGAGRAFDDTKRAQRALASTAEDFSFFQGGKEQFLRQSFGRPVSIQKVKLLASRVHTELVGVTESMAQVLSRNLLDGLVQGQNPRQIGRTISQSIDISRARANTIARTEIIRTHAEGQLDAMEEMGVKEVGVAVEWSTAGDDRVCPLCSPMQGVVFKLEDARGLIPRHPNCRCAHVPANVGESEKGQKRTKTAIERAIDRSVKAELPKLDKTTLAKAKTRSTWPGSRVRAKAAPEAIV